MLMYSLNDLIEVNLNNFTKICIEMDASSKIFEDWSEWELEFLWQQRRVPHGNPKPVLIQFLMNHLSLEMTFLSCWVFPFRIWDAYIVCHLSSSRWVVPLFCFSLPNWCLFLLFARECLIHHFRTVVMEVFKT